MTADPSGVKGFSAPEPLQRSACWEMKSLYKKSYFKETSLTRLIAPAFSNFMASCQAQICHLAAVTLVIASDFFFCLRWSWLQWRFWRIWLLEAAPPPCSLWSCRCRWKRWWSCTKSLFFVFLILNLDKSMSEIITFTCFMDILYLPSTPNCSGVGFATCIMFKHKYVLLN